MESRNRHRVQEGDHQGQLPPAELQQRAHQEIPVQLQALLQARDPRQVRPVQWPPMLGREPPVVVVQLGLRLQVQVAQLLLGRLAVLQRPERPTWLEATRQRLPIP